MIVNGQMISFQLTPPHALTGTTNMKHLQA